MKTVDIKVNVAVSNRTLEKLIVREMRSWMNKLIDQGVSQAHAYHLAMEFGKRHYRSIVKP